MLRIGLTGGIGSGKSTAAKVFTALGIPVYDSDSRAKELMVSPSLSEKIKDLVGEEAYREGVLDKAFIAGRVFTDKTLLGRLNGIVHPAVMEDFDRWAREMEACGYPYVIQENAIMFDHGFDRAMDHTITVSAPQEERVVRASTRDGHDPEDIRRRMANQMSDGEREQRADYTVHNGENDLLVPQLVKLHELFTTG